MKILYVASEAAPFIKVGGLGDVAGALPKELCRAGDDCRVILPYYGAIAPSLKEKCTYRDFFFVKSAGEERYCGIFEAEIDGVIYYLLDNEFYFHRETMPSGSPFSPARCWKPSRRSGLSPISSIAMIGIPR